MTRMRNWSAFRLTLALTPLNAVLSFNSTLVLFHRELYLKWLKLMQHPQKSCLRFSQYIYSLFCIANPCNIVIKSNIRNFYTTSDFKWNYFKRFYFWDSCHFVVLQENRIPLHSSSNRLNCTTIILLKTINNVYF